MPASRDTSVSAAILRLPHRSDLQDRGRSQKCTRARNDEEHRVAPASGAAHDDDRDPCHRISVALQAESWDCVLVGGGIRKREDLMELFESVVNLVVRHAPRAATAFNSTPDDIADAVSRRMG